MHKLRHPGRWLAASTALLLVSPFLVFPEIMGDLGPRNVPLWRNFLGAGLLVLALCGMVLGWLQIFCNASMRKRSHGSCD